MKTWYAAHIVMFVEFKQPTQVNFPIWENIVLIDAESEEQAFQKADSCGRDGEGDADGTFRWGDRPARWVFAGVRKLTECALHGMNPRGGDEVTFTEFEAQSRDEVRKFVAGDPIRVQFCDRFSSIESNDEVAGQRLETA